jgi:hypothetical protein
LGWVFFILLLSLGIKKAAGRLPFAGSCCKRFYPPKKKNIFLLGWYIPYRKG